MSVPRVEGLVPIYKTAESKKPLGMYTQTPLEAAFSQAITSVFGASLDAATIENSCIGAYLTRISQPVVEGERIVLFQYHRFNPRNYPDIVVARYITSCPDEEFAKLQQDYPNLLTSRIPQNGDDFEQKYEEIDKEFDQRDAAITKLDQLAAQRYGRKSLLHKLTDPGAVLDRVPTTQWPERFSLAVAERTDFTDKPLKNFDINSDGAINGTVLATAYSSVLRRLIMPNPPWEQQETDPLPKGVEVYFPNLFFKLHMVREIAVSGMSEKMLEEIKQGKVHKSAIPPSYYDGKAPTIPLYYSQEPTPENFMNKFVGLAKQLARQI